MGKYFDIIDSPLGEIIIVFDNDNLHYLGFIGTEVCESRVVQFRGNGLTNNKSPLSLLITEQLSEYFDGKRREFTIPYLLVGTKFQESCWISLCDIPFGSTISYKEQAIIVGNEKAVRAVGSSNGRNPISIIVPCHRVITSNGGLTGYAGYVWRKEWLIEHEKSVILINK